MNEIDWGLPDPKEMMVARIRESERTAKAVIAALVGKYGEVTIARRALFDVPEIERLDNPDGSVTFRVMSAKAA